MPNPETTDDYANRVDYLRQIADEIDDRAAHPPCSEAEIVRQAADEIERLRKREAHLLSVIRDYNPDDALFDHEKEMHRVG